MLMKIKAQKPNFCKKCGRYISISAFRSSLNITTYHDTKLCQKCQDDVFGPKFGAKE